jgi:polyisoprenoid-binding protein YceI
MPAFPAFATQTLEWSDLAMPNSTKRHTTSTALTCLAGLASGLLPISVNAAPTTYAIDPTHTFVTFEARHFGTSTNRGRFDKKSGTLVLDKAARTGRIDIVIDMASISTGTPGFDSHLRDKDFFDVGSFASATFTSDKLVFEGEKVAAVDGRLTMLGKTQPVTLKAVHSGCYDNPRLKREVCGGDFEATITRSAFGMTYGLPGIPDEVKLVIQVEAIRQ